MNSSHSDGDLPSARQLGRRRSGYLIKPRESSTRSGQVGAVPTTAASAWFTSSTWIKSSALKKRGSETCPHASITLRSGDGVSPNLIALAGNAVLIAVAIEPATKSRLLNSPMKPISSFFGKPLRIAARSMKSGEVASSRVFANAVALLRLLLPPSRDEAEPFRLDSKPPIRL